MGGAPQTGLASVHTLSPHSSLPGPVPAKAGIIPAIQKARPARRPPSQELLERLERHRPPKPTMSSRRSLRQRLPHFTPTSSLPDLIRQSRRRAPRGVPLHKNFLNGLNATARQNQRCHPGACPRDPIHVDACCGDYWCPGEASTHCSTASAEGTNESRLRAEAAERRRPGNKCRDDISVLDVRTNHFLRPSP